LADCVACWKRSRKRAPAQGSVSPHVGAILGLRGSMFRRMDKAIALLKLLHPNDLSAVIEELRSFTGAPIAEGKPSFLTWDQIREMHSSGLISFGSHTHNHAILTNVSSDTVDEELRVSMDELCSRGVADRDSIPFCYPSGKYNDDVRAAVKRCGYRVAVSTKHGWVTTDSDRFALPRIGMHQDMSSTRALFLSRIVSALK
jgi:hypothetical protein